MCTHPASPHGCDTAARPPARLHVHTLAGRDAARRPPASTPEAVTPPPAHTPAATPPTALLLAHLSPAKYNTSNHIHTVAIFSSRYKSGCCDSAILFLLTCPCNRNSSKSNGQQQKQEQRRRQQQQEQEEQDKQHNDENNKTNKNNKKSKNSKNNKNTKNNRSSSDDISGNKYNNCNRSKIS